VGYNSLALILNDAIHRIDEDPGNWWEGMRRALLSMPYGEYGPYVSAGNHVNGSTAVWNQHADHYGLILVGGNTAKVLNAGIDEEDIQRMKTILDQHGYNVVKKRNANSRNT
jgi:hypothetical protein